MASIRGRIFAGQLFNYITKPSLQCIVVRHGSHSKYRPHVLIELQKRKEEMGPEKPVHRNTFLEWNYKAELSAFATRLSERFEGNTLQAALTQRSHVIFEEERQRELGIDDPKGALEDNGALVEKGEAFMRDVIARYLRTALPLFPEDGILAVREFLMSEENLSFIVSNIGAEELILCTDFPVEKSTLASTMCSLVGAVEESSGRDRAALFVRDFVIARLSGQEINALWSPKNPIAVLTDILKRDGKEAPEPRLISHFGSSTIIPSYRVGMYCSKEFIGAGNGETVDIAVEQAALDSLARLWGTLDGKLQLPFRLGVSVFKKNTNENMHLQDWSIQKARQSAISSQ